MSRRLIRRMWAYLPIPLATSSACSSPSTGGPSRATSRYGRSLRGDIENWLDANVALSEPAGRAGGRRPGPTPASGWRSRAGLLLDLLATGDRAGVDAALEVFAGALRGAVVGASATRRPGGTSDRAS